MPAFTSIIAGVSALSGIASNVASNKAGKQAEAEQKRQQEQQKRDLAASRAAATKANERDKLSAQDKSKEFAEVELGSKSTESAKVADKKKKAKESTSAGTKVGGLLGGGSNIGGL